MMAPVRLSEICAQLNAEQARYLLVGSSAMYLWGSSGSLRDIELLIEPTRQNVRRVVRAFRRAGFELARDELGQEVLTQGAVRFGDLPRIYLYVEVTGLSYRGLVPGSHTFILAGTSIPTASVSELLAARARNGGPNRPLSSPDPR